MKKLLKKNSGFLSLGVPFLIFGVLLINPKHFQKEVTLKSVILNYAEEKPGYGPATDLNTRTVFCGCPENASESDTLVSINGSKVCVTSAKTSGSKLIKATLIADVNIQVGGQVFPLKANEKVEFEPGNFGLKQAVLRANIPYEHKSGIIELAGNKTIYFHEAIVKNAFIHKACEVNILDKPVTIIPTDSRNHDIAFDFTNELSEFTIGKTLTIGDQPQFNFPEKSNFFCSGGKIEKVNCPTPSTCIIGDRTYHVGGDAKNYAYEFNKKGEIEEIIAGEGNFIEIEGQQIAVEVGSKMKFEYIEGVCYVEKFYTADEVTVNVNKKGKVSPTTVKPGKSIQLEKGIVVKAG